MTTALVYNPLIPLNLDSVGGSFDPSTIDASTLSGTVYNHGTVPGAIDTDFIALSQTKVAAGPLTLTGNPVIIANYPKRVTLTSPDNNAGTGYVCVGLDKNGDPQTSASIVGPNNETVTFIDSGGGELYWTQIDSITADGASTNIESGYSMARIVIDANNGYEQSLVLNGPVELVFENLKASPESQYFHLILTDAGSFAIELPSGIDYGDSGPPALSIGKVDHLGMYTQDSGVRWHVGYDLGYAI